MPPRPTYGLRTARDLFAKLRREADRLESEVTSDHLFNFVVTGLHLIEWIDKDPTVDRKLKERTRAVYDDPHFRICKQLANSSKHFAPSKHSVRSATSQTGYGVGRYGKGGYGKGEEAIVITTDGGDALNALTLRDRVLELYAPFFPDEGQA